MLVWLVIAAVLGFGFLGLKKGLYVMFSTLFNLLFAVFVSILSTRTLLSYSPQYEHNGYYASLGLFLYVPNQKTTGLPVDECKVPCLCE